MILCGNNCEPCCDFCVYAKHGTVCGYCDDFHCFQSLVPLGGETQEGDEE